jgi:hypothetical protein
VGKFLKKAFIAFLIIGLVVVLLPLAAGAGVVALAYSTGTVTVDVDDGQGTDFTLPLPAGLIPMALRFLPDEVCRELKREVEPSWEAVRAAVDEMNRIPDAVLVQVESGRDHVRVVKEDGRIVVRVWSDEEHVNVAIPLHIVSSVVNQVERTCF